MITTLDKFQLFTIFGLFWLGLGWLGLFLALFGIFFKAILAIYMAAGFIFLVYIFWKNYKKIKLSATFIFVLAISVSAIVILSYFTTPAIFSGRDQGSLSEAAIRLSQNHQLEFSSQISQEFFKIYGPGRALNFPGFNYTAEGNLITQFPLGYAAWLAVFFSFFGLGGLVAANAVPAFIFSLSFYLLARQFMSPLSSVISLFLFLSSFVFSWFFKFTLSENLALGFLWFGILEFVLFLKNKDRFHFLAALLSLGFLCFVRVEALAFLVIIFAILIVKYKKSKHFFSEVIGKKILWISAGMAAIYVFSVIINVQFYIAFAKGFFGAFSLNGQEPADSHNFFLSVFYVVKIFSAYALLSFLLLGSAGVFYLIRKRQWELLIPGLIVLPTAIYLFNPSISLDHPWMLRRFLFALIPASIFYAVCFLDRFFKQKFYFYALSVFLLILNLLVSFPYLPFSPDKKLLSWVGQIARDFKDTDLILVDREATGDGWSMISGPLNFLYGKQAVYFFNPRDLEKMDTSRFNAIYLIIPDSNLEFYQASGIFARFASFKDYQIERDVLKVKVAAREKLLRESVELPEVRTKTIRGKIYLLKNTQ